MLSDRSPLRRHDPRALACALLALLFGWGAARPAHALERLCDPSVQNCRTELINLIRAETVEINVGLWFMEDNRWATELIARWNAGVMVRIIMDPRADAQHALHGPLMQQMANAGIPMRKKVGGGIEHWKAMVLAGQGVVYFGSANFSVNAWVPNTPYVDYVDETIYGTDDAVVVQSFMRKFDDAWVGTGYQEFANSPAPSRHYPLYSIDPDLNFPPDQSYANRSVGRYRAETQKIDVIIYRITDQRHTDAIINAIGRGVPVRMIVEPQQYRDVTRLWHSWNVDRLYMAGAALRNSTHTGLNHQKSMILYGQGMTIFGSSNWTSPSSDSQHEHNYFTTKPGIFSWFVSQFERKWNNSNPVGSTETSPFVPLPPDRPVYQTPPANGAVGVPTTGQVLTWYAGPWAHNYDIYFGTNPIPPLLAADQNLGPSESTASSQWKRFTLPPLAGGTTYYWKIVSKTMANLTKEGSVWSFTTAGAPPPPPPGAETTVLWTANVPLSAVHGDWTRVTDGSAAGGAALHNPNLGRAKVAPPLASPTHYFEIAFDALGGVGYHVWVRMKAQSNSTANDSVHFQFSDSTDSIGTPFARIGSSTSAEMVLQPGASGPVPQGWGWADNGWGAPGALLYFANDGTHVLRVQMREDGPTIDQIVLSPDTYITAAPGPRRNDTTILTSNGGGEPPPPPPPPDLGNTVVLWTEGIPTSSLSGNWLRISDATAAGGAAVRNPNAGAAKVAPALASPGSYFQTTFEAEAGREYHVWVRMRAESNSTANDSVHVQFSDSLVAGGAYARIGSTTSLEYVLQAGSGGASPRGWGWTENGWGSFGAHITFASGGTHTIRIQQREDGPVIDQIVISPDAFLTAAPGGRFDDTTILPASGSSPPSSAQSIVLRPGALAAADLNGRRRSSRPSVGPLVAIWLT